MNRSMVEKASSNFHSTRGHRHPRRWFNLLSLREQVLLLGFMWVILLGWLFSLLGDFRLLREDAGGMRVVQDNQELYLEERLAIQEGLAEAEGTVDASKTFSANELSERMDTYSRRAGFDNFAIAPPSTEQRDRFIEHSVRVNVRRASIRQLIDFDRLIKQESPYLRTERVQVSAVPSDPSQLDATFTVTSFELEGASG